MNANTLDTLDNTKALAANDSNANANTKALDALREQTFSIAFESALEHIANGSGLSIFLGEYHTPISPAHFRRWIHSNPKRRNAYIAAKAIGAEAVEDDLIRISDGLNPDFSPSPNDIARSTLQISTRKWLLAVWDRKRYGDTKHIEQVTTTNVDVTTLSSTEIQRRILESLGMDANTFDMENES